MTPDATVVHGYDPGLMPPVFGEDLTDTRRIERMAKSWMRYDLFSIEDACFDESFDSALISSLQSLALKMGTSESLDFAQELVMEACEVAIDPYLDADTGDTVTGSAKLFAIPLTGKPSAIRAFVSDGRAFAEFVRALPASRLVNYRSLLKVSDRPLFGEDLVTFTPSLASSLARSGLDIDSFVGSDGNPSYDFEEVFDLFGTHEGDREDRLTTCVILGLKRSDSNSGEEEDFVDSLDMDYAMTIGVKGIGLPGDRDDPEAPPSWKSMVEDALRPFGISASYPLGMEEAGCVIATSNVRSAISALREAAGIERPDPAGMHLGPSAEGIPGVVDEVTCTRTETTATFVARYGRCTLSPVTVAYGPLFPDPSAVIELMVEYDDIVSPNRDR